MKTRITVILIILITCISLMTIYKIDNYNENIKFIHLSIDDTIKVFEDLTKNELKYESIFDNNILKFLKEYHDLYNAKFSMYVFYEYDGCTEKFAKEFEQNSDWLKFGFHALNAEVDYSKISSIEATRDYELVINELKRIVGEKSLTTVIY